MFCFYFQVNIQHLWVSVCISKARYQEWFVVQQEQLGIQKKYYRYILQKLKKDLNVTERVEKSLSHVKFPF